MAAGRRCAAGAALLLFVLAVMAAPPVGAHGNLHEQIEAVSARLRAEPRNVELLFHRAELYRDHEEWALAAADYDRVEALAPGRALVHLGRGKLLLATGEPAAALAQLDRFLAREPTHVDGLATRARIRLALVQPRDAAADFAAAIAASPGPDAELYLAQADALMAAGDENAAAALAVLDAGSARLGKPVTLGLRAVEVEQRRGDVEAALSRLDALRAGQARQEGWLERRGNINAVAGRDADARRDWQAAQQALDALPPRLASTPAMRELRARLARKLAPPAP
jgi:Tfp pilus assembly protein PilF